MFRHTIKWSFSENCGEIFFVTIGARGGAVNSVIARITVLW